MAIVILQLPKGKRSPQARRRACPGGRGETVPQRWGRAQMRVRALRLRRAAGNRRPGRQPGLPFVVIVAGEYRGYNTGATHLSCVAPGGAALQSPVNGAHRLPHLGR